MSPSRGSFRGEGMEVSTREEDNEDKKALEELKEKFDAYRKEKAENHALLQQQTDKLRDESSELKIQNAKLVSKVWM